MSIRSNVDARRLDQRITFQRKTQTPDGEGGQTITWNDLVSCWAAVDGEKASGERYVENGIRSVADSTFWIRADVMTRYGITLTDRILWRNVPYNISDMPDQQLRGRLIAVIARTGLNAG